MSLKQRYLDAMLVSDDPLVDQALAQSLPNSDPATRSRVAHALLDRGQTAGLIGLTRHYLILDSALQHRIAESAQLMYRPLREAASQASSRPSAIELIRRSSDPRLAYLLIEMLNDSDREVRDASGKAFLAMCELARTDHQPGTKWSIDATLANYLVSCAEQAIERYEHHACEAIIDASLWLLPRTMGRWSETMNRLRHAGLQATRNQLSKAKSDAAARALLVAMKYPELTTSAIEGLERASQSESVLRVVGQFAMLKQLSVRKALSVAKSVGEIWAQPEGPIRVLAHQQSEGRASGAVAMLSVLPMSNEARIDRLMDMAKQACERAQIMVVRRLGTLARKAHQAKEPPTLEIEALVELASGQHESISATTARLASATAMSIDPVITSDILESLVCSQDATVRLMAAKRLAPLGFERLWSSWSRLPEDRCLAAARALIQIDPHFHAHLGEKLLHQDTSVCIRALQMIRQMNQAEFFESALLQLSQSEDVKLAAAAVTSLGAIETAQAQQRVIECLSHSDPRVRANALEVLPAEEARSRFPELMAMAEEEAPRPRAVAIETLLAMGVDDAMTELREMLEDTRANHRASALWLVRHLGLLEVARTVAEMAVSDPDDEIQSRANMVIQQLIYQLNPKDDAAIANAIDTTTDHTIAALERIVAT